eukprot:1999955-Amphidinium_carterae.1
MATCGTFFTFSLISFILCPTYASRMCLVCFSFCGGGFAGLQFDEVASVSYYDEKAPNASAK